MPNIDSTKISDRIFSIETLLQPGAFTALIIMKFLRGTLFACTRTGKPSRIFTGTHILKFIVRFSCASQHFLRLGAIYIKFYLFVNSLSTFPPFLPGIKKYVHSFQAWSILWLVKKKPIKLNSLQRRTLALFQVLAASPQTATRNQETGEVTVSYLPEPHGDHVHMGDFVISAQDASGFANEAVWRALERKGMITSHFPIQAVLSSQGLNYDTGLKDQFEHSDH